MVKRSGQPANEIIKKFELHETGVDYPGESKSHVQFSQKESQNFQKIEAVTNKIDA